MPDGEAPEMDTSTPEPRAGLLRRLRRIGLYAIGPLILFLAGGTWLVLAARYVSTENAYLKAAKIAVSADVEGHVEAVLVEENQVVEAGTVLFRIDDERYRIALEQKESALSAARQQVESLRALYLQKTAELQAVREEIAYFESDFSRMERLRVDGIVSSANHDESRRDLMMARHRVDAVRHDVLGALAKLGGDPEAPVDRHPEVLEALTEWQRAQLDLARTEVVAPADGVVSNIELEVGEYVEVGTPVFSLVETGGLWIEANLKETDLTHVRVGQAAEVEVDTYPGRTWRAAVASIAPATGAEFALLPPQNASGNWVKVVQRVPVRLELETRPGDPPLRAGMSVRVVIDTEVELDLPGPIGSAVAWVRGGT